MQLKTYLDQHGISATEFAQTIQVRPWTVFRYVAGDRMPTRPVMSRIVDATGGAVAPNDFYQVRHDASAA